MKYYNGKKTIEINEDWDESPREAYREMIITEGFLPVVEAQRPEDSRFVRYSNKFEKENDKYVEVWVAKAMPIHINVNKLLAHPSICQKLPSLIALMKSDAKMSKWLVKDAKYLRGSEMALYAQKALGMSESEMEAIVLECR